MPLVQPTTGERTYPTSRGWRLLIYLLAPPLIALFLALPFLFTTDAHDQPMPLGFTIGVGIFSVAFGLFLLYCLFEAIRWRLIITPDKLISTGVLKTTEIALADISGFRIDQNYTRVYRRGSRKAAIKFGYTTADYQQVQQWLFGRFPNLDEVEIQQAEEALLADTTLGADETIRATRLAAARRTASVLTAAASISGGWLLLQPEPYRWAIGAGLLVPLLATAALWLHPGLLGVAGKRNGAYPSIAVALLLPSTMLILRSLFDGTLVSYAPLWPLAGSVAGVFALVLLAGNLTFLRRPGFKLTTVLAAVGFAALYGFGATTAANMAFDESRPQAYQAQVLSKHVSGGRTRTYELRVAAWGPFTAAEDVTVSEEYYDRVEPGSTVTMLLLPGRLGLPWYTVAE